MLLIWGHKEDLEFLGMVTRPCPRCGGSPCGLYRAKRKFTLYGVPAFTTRQQYVLGCQPCDAHWQLDEAEGEALHESVSGGQGRSTSAGVAAESGGARSESSVVLTCPRCGQKNRVSTARRAVAVCGRCGRPL